MTKGKSDAFAASNSGADNQFSNDPVGEIIMPCQSACWIEIELLDEAGNPVPGEPYWLKTPKGDVRRGKLDGRGMAHIHPVPCGLCQIRFPGIDEDDWVMAIQSDAPLTQWIELEMQDEDGDCVPGEKFELTDSAGNVHTGQLDAQGFARLEKLPPGFCEVRFPDLDKLDWIS